MAGKIIQFRRQLELPLKWFNVNWTYYDASIVSRPVEDKAFNNLQKSAKTWRLMSSDTGFSSDLWRVYLTDLELRYRWQNATVYAIDIAKSVGFTVEKVLATLRQLDEISEIRYLQGLPTEPPIPIFYIAWHKRVKNLEESKKIKRVG